MKIKQKTVADKVHDLLAKGNHESSDESAEETTAPRITEFDDDEYELPETQITEFRKRNIKLLSDQNAKYKGKISTRKELEEDDDDDDEEENSASNFYEASDSEEEAKDQVKQQSKRQIDDDDDDDDEDSAEDDEEEGNSDDDDDEDDDSDIDDDEDEEEEDVETSKSEIVSETNKQIEMQKGICVQNQLRIWERLLELRIQSQKILTKSNQLPAPEIINQVSDIDKVQAESVQSVSNLLHKLLDLQSTLKSQFPEMSSQVRKHKISHAAANEPPSKKFAQELEGNFEGFRDYRNSVLLKWDDRTKLMTPGSGNKRKSAQEDFDILKKITHALSSRKVLIERSQTLTLPTKPMAANEIAVEDENHRSSHVYDDSDFYHQQLRELIEYKANTTSNMSEVTRQYVELQKLRQKMKKKVDTRASKGRKIRYVVHNKLLNFMAPEDNNTWTDESKDELYKSLFAA